MEVDEESGPVPPSYPQVTTTQDEEEEEEGEGESPPPRRFRLVFLDHNNGTVKTGESNVSRRRQSRTNPCGYAGVKHSTH